MSSFGRRSKTTDQSRAETQEAIGPGKARNSRLYFFYTLVCKYCILSIIAQAAWQLTEDDLKLLVAAKEKKDKQAEVKTQEDGKITRRTKQNELLRRDTVKVLKAL